MAYTITKTDGTVLVTLSDGAIDNSTSLTLIGKNHFSYGLSQNENFVQLLENFSNSSTPTYPLVGQLWFDNAPNNSKIKVFDGLVFKEVGSAIVSDIEPTTWTEGDLWLNSATGQLYVKSQGTAASSEARLIGPVADPGLGNNGTSNASILDNAPSPANHDVLQTYVNGDLSIILSNDPIFTPASPITGFTSIAPGLNLSSLGVLSVFSDDGIYTGGQLQGHINAIADVLTIENRFINGRIDFAVYTNPMSATVPLTVDGVAGYVGIQTTTPQVPLDVVGTIQTDTGLNVTAGNILLGGVTQPGIGSGCLVLTNGIAPNANVPNGVSLFAEDISSSSELRVRDEAGNVTTLSPHNFSLIPNGPSEPLAWAYYSENNGAKINVDMLKLARLVEQLTGEKLVYTEAAK